MKPGTKNGLFGAILLAVFLAACARNERNNSMENHVEKMRAELASAGNRGWGGNPTNAPICEAPATN